MQAIVRFVLERLALGVLAAAVLSSVAHSQADVEIYKLGTGTESPSAAETCQLFCAKYNVAVQSNSPTRPNPFNICLTQTNCKCNNNIGATWIGPLCPSGLIRTYTCGASHCSTQAEIAAEQLSTNPASCLCDDQCPKGNPVYPSSGSKIDEVTDFRTGGAIPLEVRRLYASTRLNAGTMAAIGNGWRLSFEASLQKASSTRIQLVLPSGAAYTLDKQADGVFRPTGEAKDVTATQSMTPVETFDVTLETDDLYRFQTIAGHFRPVLFKQKSGYQLTINYDAAGLLSTVVDSFGRSLTFVWSGSVLSQVQAPGSTVVNYNYEYAFTLNGTPVADSRRLKTVTIQSGGGSETTTYHYENASWPYALTGITDARGVRYATYTYDSKSRVTISEHDGGADRMTFAYGNLPNGVKTTTVTNALGKSGVHKYQSVSGKPRLIGVDGLASTNCPASATAVAYDASGRLDQTTDEEGRVTKYVNDARGLPTSITQGFGTPEAKTTNYTYHATLRVPTQIVETGRTTNLTWNASGQMTTLSQVDTTTHTVPYSTNGQTRTWTYAYGTAGILLSVDGPLAGAGDTVTYGYNANGYVTSITNELGHITNITAHNGRGQPTTVVDPNNITTNLAYDFQGRLTTITVNPGASQAVTTMEYNAIGQITRITRPDGSFLTYTYNNARRLTAVASSDNERIEYTHDLMGGITQRVIKSAGGAIVFNQTQAFDELGRLLRHIGAASQTTTFGYEKNDNLKTVTDPRSGVYAYAYDAVNRLIRETDQEGSQVNLTLDKQDEIATYKDPRNLETTYVRNGFGEAIRQTSPDTGVTDFVRDARGLVTQTTDARGVVTNSSYDVAGRRLTKTFPAATAENVTYGYDAITGGNKGVGRLTSIGHEGGSIALVYDARGNVTAETRVIAGSTFALAYAYDLADRLTEVTYPSGRIVTYARDGMGRIASVTTRKTVSDPLVTLASGVTWAPMSSQLKDLTHGNGLSLTHTWTLDYELGRCEVKDGAVPVIDLSYARADALNLTGITDAVTPGNSMTFGYSAANRLNSAAGPWGTLTWQYDGVGNRTQEVATPPGGSAATDTYAYPGTSNRTATVTRGAQTLRSFGYDNAGNLISDSRLGSVFAYTYNNANRLKTVSYEGNLKGTYTYNGLEQLITRQITNSGANDGTVHTVHDRSGNVIAEADASGQTSREYIWLPGAGAAGTDLPLAVMSGVDTGSPVLYHVHADHLGRPIRMTDAAKVTQWQAVWSPWGAPHSITGPASLDARFPGQWFQLETGLHYNWHRHYDASIGRYTQPDPLGFVDGPSIYAYASGAPLTWIDPLGLSPETPTGPRVYDPRTGKQIYPPQSQPPTQESIEPPQPRPPKPDFTLNKFCDRTYEKCVAACARCPGARTKMACLAACFAWRVACRNIKQLDE